MEVESGVLKLNCKMTCYHNNDLTSGSLFLKLERCEPFPTSFKEGANSSLSPGNNVTCNFDLHSELFGTRRILI